MTIGIAAELAVLRGNERPGKTTGPGNRAEEADKLLDAQLSDATPGDCYPPIVSSTVDHQKLQQVERKIVASLKEFHRTEIT